MKAAPTNAAKSSTIPVAPKIPQHVAVIMDGNGRWAKAKGLARLSGHKAGAKTVRTVVEESRRIGVRYLTLYTFSSENWARPQDEVSGLMSLLLEYLRAELDTLTKNGIRLRAIGDLSLLPPAVYKVLSDTIESTRQHQGMDLILALSYGSRDEIVEATKRIASKVADGDLKISEINHQVFQDALYAPDVPDPDLLIRTSNEFRVSNFLLWQIAYSELVISPVPWPEFGKDAYLACIDEYGKRTRRFGLTDEQLKAAKEDQLKSQGLS